jgi:hypothetical protein
VFSQATIDCGIGQPLFWKAGWKVGDDTALYSDSHKDPLNIQKCHVSPIACDATIVAVGTASSKYKGKNPDTETKRALDRGGNLASFLSNQRKCNQGFSASQYVLNLGRYSEDEEKDDHQREVLTLIGTGSDDSSEAAVSAALEKYLKEHKLAAGYTACEFYKWNSEGKPPPPTKPKICADQSK